MPYNLPVVIFTEQNGIRGIAAAAMSYDYDVTVFFHYLHPYRFSLCPKAISTSSGCLSLPEIIPLISSCCA